MSDVFNADQAPVLTLDTFVGEDKKYKTPDELAKAYAHADDHIQELRRDLAEARAAKDLAERTKNQQPPENREPAPAHQPQQEAPKPNGDEDWRSKIRETVLELSQEDRSKRNVELAQDQIVAHYGSVEKAAEAVRNRANELGVSAEWLRDSAARSPKAFYASMGLNPDQERRDFQTPAPRNDGRPNERPLGINSDGNKTYEYYEQMRKSKDSKVQAEYRSVATQSEMQKQAKLLGDAFYVKR